LIFFSTKPQYSRRLATLLLSGSRPAQLLSSKFFLCRTAHLWKSLPSGVFPDAYNLQTFNKNSLSRLAQVSSKLLRFAKATKIAVERLFSEFQFLYPLQIFPRWLTQTFHDHYRFFFRVSKR